MTTAVPGSAGSSGAIASRSAGSVNGSTAGPPSSASATARFSVSSASGEPSTWSGRSSVVIGDVLEVGVALLEERVAAFDGLVLHVRQPGGLAGEQLLA